MTRERFAIACVLFIFAFAFVMVVAGCNDESGHDAPIAGRDDGSWQIINAPDGYPNLATRCDPYRPGTRLYIVTHSKTDVSPTVVTDEGCK